MGTEAKCLECGEPIEVPEDAFGRKIVCPHCSSRLQVEEDGTIVPVGTGAEVTTAPRTARPERAQNDDEAEVPRRRRRGRDEDDDDEDEYPRRRRRRSFRKVGLTRQEAPRTRCASGHDFANLRRFLLILAGLYRGQIVADSLSGEGAGRGRCGSVVSDPRFMRHRLSARRFSHAPRRHPVQAVAFLRARADRNHRELYPCGPCLHPRRRRPHLAARGDHRCDRQGAF